MATLIKRKIGDKEFWMLQFYDEYKRRMTISLSTMKFREKTVIELKEIIETLLYNRINGIEAPSKRTESWIRSACPEIQNKLGKVALLERPPNHTCEELWNTFLKNKKDIKESTLLTYEAAKHRFFLFFKKNDFIEEITKETMAQFKTFLRESLAEATVAGTITKLRTVFNWAKEHGWITQSPMIGVPRGSFKNRNNDQFVTQDDYLKLLEHCPCLEWRVILALVRYGGLRCPSEVLRLRWADINWELNQFNVRSSKTERYQGKDERIVPLFPEVRKELTELFFRDESERNEYIINRYRNVNTNLGTQFARIVRMAGLKPIKRPYDNMRASRSNEIYAKFGPYYESQWIGHSSKIATDHYLSITPDDINRAAEWTSDNERSKSSNGPSPSKNIIHSDSDVFAE